MNESYGLFIIYEESCKSQCGRLEETSPNQFWDQLYHLQRERQNLGQLIWSYFFIMLLLSWIVGPSSTGFLKWRWSIAFVKPTNVQTSWLRWVQVLTKAFVFFIVPLWIFLFCFFLIVLRGIMRGYALWTLYLNLFLSFL